MAYVLVLTDGKPGHENQSRALCDGLGLEPLMLRVAYKSPFHKACSYLLDRLHICTLSLYCGELDAELAAVKPFSPIACVIGTGSNTFYGAKVIAKRLGKPCVAILNPSGYSLDGFAAILTPAFDKAMPAPNRITMPINLCPARDAYYAEQTQAFLAQYTPKKERAIAVIIGGPNPFSDLKATALKPILDAIFAATPDCEHYVTTSRRTPAEIDTLLDTYPFDYALIFSRNTFNPIPAFVSRCETLFVTADSTGMLSEAVCTGSAAVEIIDTITNRQSKFARFVQMLDSQGYAHCFTDSLGHATRKVDTTAIFDAVKAQLDLHD